MPNSIVQVIVALLVIGLIITFASPYIPPQILTMIIAVVAIGLLIWLLKATGLMGGPPVV